jgi:hypothetical protein
MKKLLLIGLVALFAAAGCKKKDNKTPEEVYADRLNGSWNVNQLTYTATVAVPPFGNIPINGTANQAGSITFNTPAKTASYDIRFLPSLGGLPIGVIDSVKFIGSGTFTNTTTSITLTEPGGTLTFNVIANDENVQVVTTQANYMLDSLTVPVTMELRLQRR